MSFVERGTATVRNFSRTRAVDDCAAKMNFLEMLSEEQLGVNMSDYHMDDGEQPLGGRTICGSFLTNCRC